MIHTEWESLYAKSRIDCMQFLIKTGPVSLFHVSFYITNNHRHSKRFAIHQLNSNTRLTLLLMLAGDVNPNPGPQKLKYLCNIYNTAARRGQECIECESCNGWFHKQCLGLSAEIYDTLAKHASYSWLCVDCGMPNLHTSLFFGLDGYEN